MARGTGNAKTLKSPLTIPKHPQSGSNQTSPVSPKTPADEGIEFFESHLRPDEEPIKVYELRLDVDGGPRKDLSYVRLPPAYVPYIVRVSIVAGTPAARNGLFVTNFPLDGGAYSRDHFATRRLPTDYAKPIQIDLPISHAGAFVYWIEYDSGDGKRIQGRKGYLNVDPALKAKCRTPILHPETLKPLSPAEGGITVSSTEYVNLPLDALSILSIISKWMGPVSEWRKHFEEASQRGYNMLHYTPLQERGHSDSPFSIRNQMQYDPSMKTDSAGFDDILRIAREEYDLLSLTDVVLNHTADNSPWLLEHPEAGYSPSNSPHLSPALDLDNAIIEFSGSLTEKGLPTFVESEADIKILVDALEADIKDLRLWEYYVMDRSLQKTLVKNTIISGDYPRWSGQEIGGKSVIELANVLRSRGKLDGLASLASRFCVTVDTKVAAALTTTAFPLLTDPEKLADAWALVVDAINMPLYREWEEDMKVALQNIRGRVKYLRLETRGPRLGKITKKNPLVETYFTRLFPTQDADPRVYSLANNGWIWNADARQNFALLPSKAYLRREVIAWGDCVKLRYGSSPSANPWLWAYMTGYVTHLARTFDGFRIDNCHSTPLEVGTYMLDAARVVNPNLYVCAELFTGSEELDFVFVRELGLNSLIREAYNAHDPKELSRLVYRYGIGKPVGSMDTACLTSVQEIPSPTGKGPIRTCVVTPIRGSLPHALFYDLTHDNESPLDKRSAQDALSTGALVAFSCCAIGSVKGFDDLYPKLLNLVNEKRKYEITGLEAQSGIAKVKRVLNSLHREMMLDEFHEGHVHQENEYVVVHRMHPVKQKGYLLVAHTAFLKGRNDRGSIDSIKLRRTRARFILGAGIEIPLDETINDLNIIRGLPSKLYDIQPSLHHRNDDEGPYAEITVPDFFPPGSIMIFETQLQDHDPELDAFCTAGAQEAFADLGFTDLNIALYRADGEERDATAGKYGAYLISDFGRLVYCGLEGWMHPLRGIVQNNDLGHPLCAHLRQGTWAFTYIHERLTYQSQRSGFPNLEKPAKWLKERFDRVANTVPYFLRPKYFALIVYAAYAAARRSVVEQSSNFVTSGHNFTQDLALCAIQMHGSVQSASLDPGVLTPSLAAGLPHFAVGWARCWGRDVFISLKGLLLTTGNFSGAKRHILAFASTLKHGLIPNLLDSVRNPRYNSRDSPWWMLQAIQDYVNSAPAGSSILSERVKRRFPQDDTWVAWNDSRAYSYSSSLAEIIQEIIQRHATGISFREHNAGPNLDMQMKDEGFNIEIRVDWTTGFLMGGSEYNCGTWMDKMGESQKAGTKGVPGTPRDGAPVEITGLLFSTLKWLSQLSAQGLFPFKGVYTRAGQKDGAINRLVTYKEWADLIQASFEKCYYVPADPLKDGKYNINTSIVNRRGIYKDVYGGTREWSDYQFRPNFPIAMTVAPELFDVGHALGALKLAEDVLRGPLGMKTLDPKDWQYRPNYDNTNDSEDPAIARGLNYHNGPEWGWPLGYFLRAYLHFSTVGGQKKDVEDVLHRLHTILLPLRQHIESDAWAGLPELTNENGEFCRDSCNTQAWSAGTLLDFLEAVYRKCDEKLV